MSSKDEKPMAPKNSERESSAADQLQSQIDALIRGEVPKDAGSLRDLVRKPVAEIRKSHPNKKLP
jgi:hypothetical protein